MRWMWLMCLGACSGGEGEGDGSARTPAEPLFEQVDLPDEVGFPEGLAFHASTRAFYIGSLEHGALQRVEADGSVSRVFEPEAGWASLGIKVHPDTGEVLVCAVKAPSTPSATSELWIHDPASGGTERVPLEGAPSNCNDLVAVGDVVYLTDREAAQIHRVDLATMSSAIWLEHPELEPGLIGNNGLELTESGDALLLGQFAPARILRVALDGSDVVPIALSGDGFGALPNGADGMAWVNGSLVVAAHGSIVRLESDDGWASAVGFAAPTPVDIVAVTEAEGALYGLNGEIIPYVLGLPADLPFELLALDMP